MSFSLPHHNSFPSHHPQNTNVNNSYPSSSKNVYEFFSKPSSMYFSIQQEIQHYASKQQRKDSTSPSSPYRNKSTPTVLYVPASSSTEPESSNPNANIPSNILSGIYSKYNKQIRENLNLSNKRVISVGFLSIHEQSVDMVNQIVGTNVFSEYFSREVCVNFFEPWIRMFTIVEY